MGIRFLGYKTQRNITLSHLWLSPWSTNKLGRPQYYIIMNGTDRYGARHSSILN